MLSSGNISVRIIWKKLSHSWNADTYVQLLRVRYQSSSAEDCSSTREFNITYTISVLVISMLFHTYFLDRSSIPCLDCLELDFSSDFQLVGLAHIPPQQLHYCRRWTIICWSVRIMCFILLSAMYGRNIDKSLSGCWLMQCWAVSVAFPHFFL